MLICSTCIFAGTPFIKGRALHQLRGVPSTPPSTDKFQNMEKSTTNDNSTKFQSIPNTSGIISSRWEWVVFLQYTASLKSYQIFKKLQFFLFFAQWTVIARIIDHLMEKRNYDKVKQIFLSNKQKSMNLWILSQPSRHLSLPLNLGHICDYLIQKRLGHLDQYVKPLSNLMHRYWRHP